MSEVLTNIDSNNELLLVSYLTRNLDRVNEVRSNKFLNKTSRSIHRGLVILSRKNLDYSTDSLLSELNTIDRSIKYSDIEEIIDGYQDFTNIENQFKHLAQGHLKFTIGESIESLLVISKSAGKLDTGKLKDSMTGILSGIDELEGVDKLQTTEDLTENYAKVLEERETRKVKRGLGFRVLNEALNNAGGAGQYTLLFSVSGVGKSTLGKNIENILINKGTPVVSFNVEQTDEDNMDLLMSIREGVSIEALHKNLKSVRKQVDEGMAKFAKVKNYRYYGGESLNLDTVRNKLIEARNYFKAEGILEESEYMFIVFDLLSDLDEFGTEDKNEITKGVKQFSKLLKEFKSHALVIVQANENKFRTGRMFSDPEQLDNFRLGLEDIYGGSGYAKKARVVLSINNPLFMKMRMFPNHEDFEMWKQEPSVIHLNCVKQNQGSLFSLPFVFDTNNSRITADTRTLDDVW